MSSIISRNPYTQEVNATFERLSNDELEQVIQQAHEAYLSRKKTPASEKKVLFHKLADLVDERNEELAKLQTIEMGMLFGASSGGLRNTANLIRWNADNFERILGDESFEHDGLTGKYKYDPLGVIYGVGPWNFPFNQVLRAAVPNILAGNTTIYKHSSNVPLCGKAIEDLFRDAGFPDGVYTNLFISGSQSEYILAHPYIQGTNLTGSEGAGSAVGSLAGKYLKPSVLELGGNDAFVLLDHEDTAKKAAEAMACRISYGGQKCNSSKRFIILEKHYDAFVDHAKAYMESLQLGDPLEAETTLPPLAREDLVKEIHDQVQRTLADGARLVTGGKIIEGTGNFYAPTILADVTPEMTSRKEEIFGPVASIIKSSSIEESIELANGSDFGLSATVFGDDMEQLKMVADQLEGGMIFINNPAGSKASLPFGGIKKTGYGKENGPEGLRAFTNKKVILFSVS